MSGSVGLRHRAWRLLRVALFLLGLVALAMAVVSLSWPGRGEEAPSPDSPFVARLLPPPELATPPPAASVTAPALPARLVIPRIGVDAPVTVKSVEPGGPMQNPNGPEDVAWYDFTAAPGQGGNAVFSGHLDYRDYGPAVFARLGDVREGDTVEVRLEDGAIHRYVVMVSVLYPADSAPSQEIVGPTGREMVTLITCGGTWQGRPQGYSHRLVVRADHL